METRPPAVTVEVEVIPDRGKRPIPLRFRSQGEVRQLIAAVAAQMHLLPDDPFDDADAIPLISLPASWLSQVVDAEITDPADEPSMSFAAVVEAVNPMDRSQLRAVIVDAWTEAPRAAEQAIADVQRNASERGQDPLDPDTWVRDCPASHPLDGMACIDEGPHDVHSYATFPDGKLVTWTDADTLAASIETGTPVIAVDDARVNGGDVLLSALADAPAIIDDLLEDAAAQDEPDPACACAHSRYRHAIAGGVDGRPGPCLARACDCKGYAPRAAVAHDPDGDGEALPVSYLPLRTAPTLAADWHPTAARMREEHAISITGGAS